MTIRYTRSWVPVLLVIGSVTLSAQWPKLRDPAVPRDAQGLVRIDAPPPRGADGKPDLSGVWLRADPEPLPSELAGLFSQTNRDPSGDVAQEVFAKPFPADPKSPPLAAFWDIATNVPGGLPLTPWAAEVKKQRMAAQMKDNPDANCMPMGITQFHMQPQPRKIIQTPKLIVILYEANYGQRTIYMDGRPLPKQGDPQPWWYGYSVGRWDGDTLVVETVGHNDQTWFDHAGNFHSDALTVIERLTRTAADVITYEATMTDPKVFTRPWTIRMPLYLHRDMDRILENECYIYAEEAGKPIRGQHPNE